VASFVVVVVDGVAVAAVALMLSNSTTYRRGDGERPLTHHCCIVAVLTTATAAATTATTAGRKKESCLQTMEGDGSTTPRYSASNLPSIAQRAVSEQFLSSLGAVLMFPPWLRSAGGQELTVSERFDMNLFSVLMVFIGDASILR